MGARIGRRKDSRAPPDAGVLKLVDGGGGLSGGFWWVWCFCEMERGGIL